jgi:hypothetical protein
VYVRYGVVPTLSQADFVGCSEQYCPVNVVRLPVSNSAQGPWYIGVLSFSNATGPFAIWIECKHFLSDSNTFILCILFKALVVSRSLTLKTNSKQFRERLISELLNNCFFIAVCGNNCSGNGACNTEGPSTGLCSCEIGFSLVDCSFCNSLFLSFLHLSIYLLLSFIHSLVHRKFVIVSDISILKTLFFGMLTILLLWNRPIPDFIYCPHCYGLSRCTLGTDWIHWVSRSEKEKQTIRRNQLVLLFFSLFLETFNSKKLVLEVLFVHKFNVIFAISLREENLFQ